jgi:protoheme ferro-lyase
VNVVTENTRPDVGSTSNWLLMSCMALLALGAGFLTVRYLIAAPASMTGYAAGALLCVFLYAVLLLRLKRIWRLLAGLGLCLLFFAAGYIVACTVYLQAPGHEQVPVLAPAQASAPGHTAVIYFTHGEPRTYEGSFDAWKHAIHEMDESGVPFVPWPFRPFFFKKVRDEYFEVGGSFHNLIHERIMERLEAAYCQAGQTPARFYMAYSDDVPTIDDAAVRAINAGASRIILLNVWMTDSDHSEQGPKRIEALHPEKYGVQLCVTDTLWESTRLMHMYVERACAASADTSRSDVGILLVAHGQPSSWDTLFPKQPVQENAFRLATKKLLVKEGFQEDRIVLACMEFRQPDIKSSVRNLLAAGVKKILVAPVNISAESIHSEHEIPSMVSSAGVPASVPVIHLGAWNDDQQVFDELLEQLESCRDR